MYFNLEWLDLPFLFSGLCRPVCQLCIFNQLFSLLKNCYVAQKWVVSRAVFWCVFSLYFVKLIQLRESNLRSGPILATFILSFYMPVHQNIYLPSKTKIEPDLRLRENLLEVNDKEGGEEKKVENLGFAWLYILLYKLQTKKTRKNNLHF